MTQRHPTHDQTRQLAHVLFESAQQIGFSGTDGSDMGSKWYWYEAESAIQAWMNTHEGEEYTLERFYAGTGWRV